MFTNPVVPVLLGSARTPGTKNMVTATTVQEKCRNTGTKNRLEFFGCRSAAQTIGTADVGSILEFLELQQPSRARLRESDGTLHQKFR